jgi:hypothetical protein
LSIAQWARARGISVRFAYAEASKGRLIITKAGRRSLITPEADKAWSNRLPTLNPPVVAYNATSVGATAPPIPPAT